MAKSDNNQMLVCGAEMLQQGRLGEGVCVHSCGEETRKSLSVTSGIQKRTEAEGE
ncbi:hypothetical protein NQZ68_018685 [Dissostichus eleginoides]|nr:hypothetical protein NQZ68_018685 [Dissostichus eleginoides]